MSIKSFIVCLAVSVIAARVGWSALLPMPKEVVYGEGFCPASGHADVMYSPDRSLPAEGYALTVEPSVVKVRYADAAGKFYAGMTLGQLRTADGRWPCVSIRDWPTYGYRCVLLDDARHCYGKDGIKRLLDQMARVKLNVFHWHFVEPGAWRMEVTGYARLTENLPSDQRYTREDVREIVNYASQLGIRVLPEVEMPGHNDITRQYPEFGHDGADGFCPSNPLTLTFCKRALDEAAAAFPGAMVHFGGDEVDYKPWKKCRRCQAKMGELGLGKVADLQAWFMGQMAGHLRSKGKTPVGWSDMLLTLDGSNMHTNAAGYWTGYGIRRTLPKDIVVNAWYGDWECAGGCGAVAANMGYKVIQYPSNHCYFDFRQGLSDDPHAYNYPTDVTLADAYLWDPRTDVSPDKVDNVLGVGCANWSEKATDFKALEWKLWPRGFATAEVGWGAPAKRDYADFAARAKALSEAFRRDGINVAPLPKCAAEKEDM